MNASTPDVRPFRLLFVCTGNTCRSPMAEIIARRRAADLGWTRVEMRSAGIAAMPGSPASPGAQRAAAAHDLDLSEHRATQLTPTLVAEADLVLTMSGAHLQQVVEYGGAGRAAMITAFASGGEDPESPESIPDPIGGPDHEYARTFDVLDDLIERVLGRIAPVVSP